MKRNTRKKILCITAALCLLLTISACSSGIRGDGKLTAQQIKGENFDSLVLSGSGEVNVRFADSYGILVTTDSNLQKYIKAEVSGGVLYIGFSAEGKNSSFSPTELIIDITMPVIKSIEASGTVSATLYEGSADDIKVDVSGASSVDAQNYQVKNAVVDLSGASSVIIWATESLSGDVSGTSSLSYKGSPRLDVETSGSGSVDPL